MVQKLGQSTLFVKVDFKGLTSVAFTDFFTSVMAFTTKLRFVASWLTSAAAFKAIKVIKSTLKLGPFARTCNPSKWEADIWGWLEVRRSAMLHFNERQRPHWACRQYGHTGGTRGWLGVERWQLCLRDTSRSANCHRRAAVGHWISLYVKCCRMVDSVPIWHTISIL